MAGHTCKVIRLDRALALAPLRASIAGRLPRAPGLSMRLGEIDGGPWWMPDPQVDVDRPRGGVALGRGPR